MNTNSVSEAQDEIVCMAEQAVGAERMQQLFQVPVHVHAGSEQMAVSGSSWVLAAE